MLSDTYSYYNKKNLNFSSNDINGYYEIADMNFDGKVK
jgi:hypothetical protein